jgi:hypothetical protein
MEGLGTAFMRALEPLLDAVAPRSADQFSRSDERFRNDLLGAVTPEQRAALEQQQEQMWRNNFTQALPLTYQTRRPLEWSEAQSNMPQLDRFAYPGRDQPAAMRRPVDPYGDIRMLGSAQYPTLELNTGTTRYQFGGGADGR